MDLNKALVTLTPEMAKTFLAVNSKNRNMTSGQVYKVSADILKKRYGINHQGIALAGTIKDPKRLIDGQKRCEAVIETGVPIKIVIFENVPEAAFKTIDDVQPRTIAFRLSSTNKLVAVAKALMRGCKMKGPWYVFSSSEVQSVLSRFSDLIEEVQSYICRSKFVGTAPMIAGFIRAITFYKNDPVATERIYKLLRSIKTMVCTDEEDAGLPVRWITAMKDIGFKEGSGSTRNRIDIYRKTEWFVDNWVQKKQIKRFNTAIEELFPDSFLDAFVAVRESAEKDNGNQ